MEYVYHGSTTHGIKSLVPHKSTHGTYVYATENKLIATVMSRKYGGDLMYAFGSCDRKVYDLVERIPHAFDKMFDTDFSIYSLDASFFKNIGTGFNEVVSEEEVPVIKEEVYSDLWDEINKYADAGLIKIYRYPDRPEYIPEDDSDLVEKAKRAYERKSDEKEKIGELARVIFYHPNIEEQIREIFENESVKIPSYDEIKEGFISRQEKNPARDYFIDNALENYEYFNGTRKK